MYEGNCLTVVYDSKKTKIVGINIFFTNRPINWNDI